MLIASTAVSAAAAKIYPELFAVEIEATKSGTAKLAAVRGSSIVAFDLLRSSGETIWGMMESAVSPNSTTPNPAPVIPVPKMRMLCVTNPIVATPKPNSEKDAASRIKLRKGNLSTITPNGRVPSKWARDWQATSTPSNSGEA